MWRTLFRLLSPAGAEAKLSTLIFHRVLLEPDPLFPEEVDAARFDAICGWVRHWFNVLPLDEAVSRLRAGSLPERSLAITFDDGYADNHDTALPILRRHGLTATFFVSTGFLDGGRMWNDSLIEAIRRTSLRQLDLADLHNGNSGSHDLSSLAARRTAIDAILPKVKYLAHPERSAFCAAVAERCRVTLPDDLMMRSSQVRALHRAGMQIGAHTVSHPILAKLSAAEARREIADSKATLEEITGQPVTLFAYPNGRPGDDYSEGTVGLVRECGFDAAMSTTWGTASALSDTYQLPRFTPWDRSRLRFAARLAGILR